MKYVIKITSLKLTLCRSVRPSTSSSVPPPMKKCARRLYPSTPATVLPLATGLLNNVNRSDNRHSHKSTLASSRLFRFPSRAVRMCQNRNAKTSLNRFEHCFYSRFSLENKSFIHSFLPLPLILLSYQP